MPVGGDALKATNKIGKFALKNADDIGIYAEILSFANRNFPDAVKKLGKNDEFVLATNKVSELGEKKITKKQYQEMLKSWTQAGIENAFEGNSGFTNGSSNINQVEYGSTDLSQEAIRFRKENNIFGGRNVAVFEYEDHGQFKTIIGVSEMYKGHAEKLVAKKLESMGISENKITRIYSELEPCSLPFTYCKNFLLRVFPQAEITYSFEYGETKESRRKGLKELLENVKILGE